MIGVEALLRWDHPEHGWVPPDEVIPLADHLGLIRPLTGYVLDTALAQCRAWEDARPVAARSRSTCPPRASSTVPSPRGGGHGR